MIDYDFEIYQLQWGAGTTYGWDKEKYGMRGIGIAFQRFNGRSALKIKSKDTIYRITKQQFEDFLREYPKSRYNAKGIQIGVVPISIMEIIREETRPIMPIATYNDELLPKQLKLL